MDYSRTVEAPPCKRRRRSIEAAAPAAEAAEEEAAAAPPAAEEEEEEAAAPAPAAEEEEEEEEEAAAPAAAEDKISLLPEHLLHEILAFLPTRQAVGTSLLSRRWRTVWSTSPDLSFSGVADFPSFADSVIHLRDPAVPLRSFSLVAPGDAAAVVSDPARLHTWIRYAAGPALQRLTLRLPVRSFAPRRRFDFDFPSAVFRLPSLKVLVLRLPFRIDWPAAAFLPSLQKLDLAGIDLRLASKDAVSAGCPALEHWRMSFHSEGRTPELEVKCPLLEVFELRTRAGSIGGLTICGANIRKVRADHKFAVSAPPYLNLSAPGLRTLEWLGPLPHSVALDPLPPAAAAAAAAGSLISTSLLLQTCRELVDLHRNRLLTGDLSVLRVDKLLLPFPDITELFGVGMFDRHDQVNPPAWVHANLKHLELTSWFEGFGSLGVAFLLKNFSKLETLHVSCFNESHIEFYGEHFYFFFKTKGGFGRGGYWDSHNLSLERLVEVSVRGFSGERYEYDFLEFLARAATSLRTMTITADSQGTGSFPRMISQKVEQLQQSFPHIEISLL